MRVQQSPQGRERQHRHQRQRRQRDDPGQLEPARPHRAAQARRGDRHQHQPRDDRRPHAPGPDDGAPLEFALGLDQQPAGPEQRITGRQRQRDAGREDPRARAVVEAGDVAAQHPALRQRGQRRAPGEGGIPPALVRRVALGAEVEGRAAQDQSQQHQHDRHVQRGQHHALRLREGDQQQAHGQDQPGLVGIPERSDRRDHAVAVGLRRHRGQQADAQVVAVQHHVEQQRHAHQGHEDHRQHAALDQWRCGERVHAKVLEMTGMPAPCEAPPGCGSSGPRCAGASAGRFSAIRLMAAT